MKIARLNILLLCALSLLAVAVGCKKKLAVTGDDKMPEGYVPVTSIELVAPKTTISLNEEVQFTATVSPEDASYPTVTWTSSNPEVASVSSSGLVKGLMKGESTIKAEAGGKDRQVAITVVKPVPTGAVDLGLSVYWGYKNIKMSSSETSVWASSETAAGDYYAWGERRSRSKTSFTRDNYWIWESGTGYKYTIIDNDHTYDPCATLYPAGTWRLPTAEEVTELINNCNKTITVIGGTVVCKLSSKTNSDVSITIPRIEASDGVGSHYWTSTFGESKPRTMLINSSGSPELSSNDGWTGCQIRPVCDK